MHSFGRVVRRHEREALLQHPSAWGPVYRADLQVSQALRSNQQPHRALSPLGVRSFRPRAQSQSSDPFADFVPVADVSRPVTFGSEDFPREGGPPGLPTLSRSRQGSSSSMASSSATTESVSSPEVDLAALPLYNGEQHSVIEDPFSSIYEAE